MKKHALRPSPVSVEALPDYHVRIVFDNGEHGVFDAKPYIRGDWYGKLRDVEFFNAVRTDGWTLVWPDGQDICPDCVYEQTVMEN